MQNLRLKHHNFLVVVRPERHRKARGVPEPVLAYGFLDLCDRNFESFVEDAAGMFEN